MMRTFSLRINGRGNAWPILIGQHHPFYDLRGAPDYANASHSILEREGEGKIVKDILIDAGHGIVPFLLRHGNRIPDALLITHPHFDHTLGMDWIIQSYYRFRKKKYPVYATKGCYEQILRTMPHLGELCAFTELSYGKPVRVREAGEGMTVTAFPVYHGVHARAAAMLLVEIVPAGPRVLFTGDVLVPMLKKSDIGALHNVDWLVTDANNRFPYPKTNHWSAVRRHPEDGKYMEPWLQELTESLLMAPHNFQNYTNYQYLLDFFRDFPEKEDYIHTVLDFATRIKPRNLLLTHYSGLEDEKYYKDALLDTSGLEKWAQQALNNDQLAVNVKVPETGAVISLGKK